MKLLERFARRALAVRLRHLEGGQLTLADEAGDHTFGDTRGAAIHVGIRDPRFYNAVAFGGHLGAAESYIDGWWTTDRLTDLVRLLVRNRSALEALETGWARLAQPARKLWHARNHNSRRGSRRNIAAHYDLGNAFFALLLDKTMTYSCGIFEHADATLEDAASAKYDRICRKLQLTSTDRLMEIGTGWGGFALHAATEYGCHVTTTTISPSQHAYATQRVVEAGLTDRIRVLRRDYRDLRGTFDKLVSIEMIEAVGHRHFRTFFEKCAALLAPDGMMALQSITIQDRYYQQALREVDFIKRYIFPGSCIPSRSVLREAAAAASLMPVHTEEIGPHYAETLRRWRSNLSRHWEQIRSLGFREEFKRLWEFYLCYCEGGFLEGALGNVQMTFTMPRVTRSMATATVHAAEAVV